MNRVKKLRLIQFSLLVLGSLMIIYTYFSKSDNANKALSSKLGDKVKNQVNQQNIDGNVFFNVEYTGLDLEGNRFILKSEEARNSKDNPEIILMKSVNGNFYFKNGSDLIIKSNKGIYNNKTLNMIFEDKIIASYEGSELEAQRAEYSNSGSFITITENVKVSDSKGVIVADELYFDIKDQTLKIQSFDNNKVNANLNLK